MPRRNRQRHERLLAAWQATTAERNMVAQSSTDQVAPAPVPEVPAPREHSGRRGNSASLVSCGGVVYRECSDGSLQFLLVGRRTPRLWALPKGTPEPGETHEQTAVREVAEETGIQPAIVASIGAIHYSFDAAGGRRFYKTVHHYLMQPVGGDPSLHDSEYDEVRWVDAQRALRLLTHENERTVLRRALAFLDRRHGDVPGNTSAI